ncbi:MAG: hypothetical protein AAF335_00650 [Bacteroidota bacterium]
MEELKFEFINIGWDDHLAIFSEKSGQFKKFEKYASQPYFDGLYIEEKSGDNVSVSSAEYFGSV